MISAMRKQSWDKRGKIGVVLAKQDFWRYVLAHLKKTAFAAKNDLKWKKRFRAVAIIGIKKRVCQWLLTKIQNGG
jgi:predicted transcriptional regulator